MTNYPSSSPVFAVPVSGNKLNAPNHITQHVQEDGEINAIITELGYLPKGTDATVRARLDRIDTLAGNAVPTAALDTDGSLSANSDSKVATQKAVKTFVASSIVPSVLLTGDQAIAGIKTFSSSPVVPDPTTGTQVANKEYVDSTSSSVASSAITTYSTTAFPFTKVASGSFSTTGIVTSVAITNGSSGLVHVSTKGGLGAYASSRLYNYFCPSNSAYVWVSAISGGAGGFDGLSRTDAIAQQGASECYIDINITSASTTLGTMFYAVYIAHLGA